MDENEQEPSKKNPISVRNSSMGNAVGSSPHSLNSCSLLFSVSFIRVCHDDLEINEIISIKSKKFKSVQKEVEVFQCTPDKMIALSQRISLPFVLSADPIAT